MKNLALSQITTTIIGDEMYKIGTKARDEYGNILMICLVDNDPRTKKKGYVLMGNEGNRFRNPYFVHTDHASFISKETLIAIGGVPE